MGYLDQSCITINRLIDGEFRPLHYFNGEQFEEARMVFERMKKLYSSLPEFSEDYFVRNYSMGRRYFDKPRDLLDRYPEVG